MEGSELGDLECGSVQVENNLARSAGSSYRFGNLSWEGYRALGCGPLRPNPIFVFFVAFVVKKIRTGNRPN